MAPSSSGAAPQPASRRPDMPSTATGRRALRDRGEAMPMVILRCEGGGWNVGIRPRAGDLGPGPDGSRSIRSTDVRALQTDSYPGVYPKLARTASEVRYVSATSAPLAPFSPTELRTEPAAPPP
ncbi:hypothetical protein ACFFX0_28830 [Citricoccus parietis]|uniref:Uncharacterized protein n=1 Tax=Citricoccus parietis TaxID=592307 RepID=A0ABV5G5R1_9MICC